MSQHSFMQKTASFMGLSALRDLVTDSMAIDMGSSVTLIGVRDRGVVIDEPSVVAVNKVTGELVAVGREAHLMQGREAREIQVVAPLVDGVVADFERTRAMLDFFVRQARSGLSQFSRRALMSVLTGVTQVEQRALLSAAESAHIGRVYMVEEGLAAALGAGVAIDDPKAHAVVDIGAGTTNIAIIANGTIVHAHAERIGGSDINAAIIDHVRRHRGLTIGAETAERLKLELASATLPAQLDEATTVKGRDVQTGSPGALDVEAGEVYAVTHPTVFKIAQAVNETLTELQPEVAADIFDRGIFLTGGGALLRGLEDYLRAETKLFVRTADDPRTAIVRGLMRMISEPLLLRRVSRSEPHIVFDSEPSPFEA